MCLALATISPFPSSLIVILLSVDFSAIEVNHSKWIGYNKLKSWEFGLFLLSFVLQEAHQRSFSLPTL